MDAGPIAQEEATQKYAKSFCLDEYSSLNLVPGFGVTMIVGFQPPQQDTKQGREQLCEIKNIDSANRKHHHHKLGLGE